MFYSKKKKQKSLIFNNSALLSLQGGVNYCYNWLLDLLNNASPLVVSQKLCNKKNRHSEALAEESLKNLLPQLGGARGGRIATVVKKVLLFSPSQPSPSRGRSKGGKLCCQ